MDRRTCRAVQAEAWLLLAGPTLPRRASACLACLGPPACLAPLCTLPCCRRSRVEAACREIGGQLVEAGQEARSSSLGSHRFSFSFLQRNWNSAWGE